MFSLRKSSSRFEFQYEYGCEHINGINTLAEVKNGTLIVSTELKPISSNQRDDLNMILRHIDSVSNIVVHEDQIESNLVKIYKNNKDKIKNKQFIVKFSDQKSHIFSIELTHAIGCGISFQILQQQ